MEKLRYNIPLIYVYAFMHMFILLLPVVVPFFSSRGMSMQEIYEIQAMFALSVVIFEVPSGYMADVVGRKKTMAFGALVSGFTFFVIGYSHDYWMFMLAEFFMGFGFAMVSGCELSLLYDTVTAQGKPAGSQTKIIGNHQFYRSIGEACAAIAASWLVVYSFEAVAIGSGISLILCFLVALFICEPPKEVVSTEFGHLENFKEAFGQIVKKGPILKLLTLNFLFWALVTYVLVWTYQKYWMIESIPLHYFGYLWAIYNLVVALGAKMAPRIERVFGISFSLVLIPLFFVTGLLCMALLGGWLGVLFGVCLNFGRGFGTVLLKERINSRITSKYRATINSLLSLGVRVGYCLLGPLIGYFVDHGGLSPVYTVAAIVNGIAAMVLLVPLLYQYKKASTVG